MVGAQLLIRHSLLPLGSANWPATLRWLSAVLVALGCVWLALLAQTLWHMVGIVERLPEKLNGRRPDEVLESRVARAAEPPDALVSRAPLAPPSDSPQVREQSEVAKPIDWPTPLRYQGAACKGLFVYGVSLLEGAPRAFAVSFATDARSQAKYLHPGQKVGDWEVLSITDDWSGSNPSVWLIHDAEVCRARLTGNPARIPPPPPPPPPPRRKRRRRR